MLVYWVAQMYLNQEFLRINVISTGDIFMIFKQTVSGVKETFIPIKFLYSRKNF